MKRRDFLKAGAALSSSLLLPCSLRANPTAPLWIHLHAGGGWDPTMLCDPKPEVNNLGFSVQTTNETHAGETMLTLDSVATTPLFQKTRGMDLGLFSKPIKTKCWSSMV